MSYSVTPIFPTPVYSALLNVEMTEEKESVISRYKESALTQGGGNLSSTEAYILEEESFSDLKQLIEEHIDNYIRDIICPRSDQIIEPYITQSWLNWTNMAESHHEHYHVNSLISGVYYIDTSELDSILFCKQPSHQYINIEVEGSKSNMFNSQVMQKGVETGELLLFPSNLPHRVDMSMSSKTRISLAFNVFIKGVIGNPEAKTELRL